MTRHTPPGLTIFQTAISGETPLYLTHGLGGEINEVFAIAQAMSGHRAAVGFQWRGLQAGELPDGTIEDMAAHFLRDLLAFQRHGPYLLCGLSMGGLVMLEAARQLTEQGHVVSLVVLLDTYPHNRLWPFSSWAQLFVHRIGHHLRRIQQMQPRQAATEFANRTYRMGRNIGIQLGLISGWLDWDASSVNSSLRNLRQSGYQALARFRPHVYSGPVVFIQAGIATTYPQDPRRVWGSLLPDMKIITLNCDHPSIPTKYALQVAEYLCRLTDEAIAQSL